MSSRARWICLWPLPSTSFCITDFRSHNRGFNVRPGVSSKSEWNPKCTYAMPIRAFLLCQASGLLIHYSSSPAAPWMANLQLVIQGFPWLLFGAVKYDSRGALLAASLLDHMHIIPSLPCKQQQQLSYYYSWIMRHLLMTSHNDEPTLLMQLVNWGSS